jgi:hypothetical protein
VGELKSITGELKSITDKLEAVLFCLDWIKAIKTTNAIKAIKAKESAPF